MKQITSLSFVMPCYNNADTVERAVAEAHDVGRYAATRFEIVVVNDASRDDSGRILENLKKKYKELRIITHTKNAGYGATIRELYYSATGEWLFSIPADYQIGASELLSLLGHANTADMIVGWRVNRQDPEARIRQSRVYNHLLRLLFGVTVHDVNSVRLMKTSVLKKIKLTSRSAFVDAELAIRMAREGFITSEVPIDHRKKDGERGGGGSFKTILPTIVDMLRFLFIES